MFKLSQTTSNYLKTTSKKGLKTLYLNYLKLPHEVVLCNEINDLGGETQLPQTTS